MKHFASLLATIALICSCSGTSKIIEANYDNKTDRAAVSLNIQVPDGNSAAAAAIRNELVKLFVGSSDCFNLQEFGEVTPDNLDAFVAEFGNARFRADEQTAATASEEDDWDVTLEFSNSIALTYESDKVMSFTGTSFEYAGGAHGFSSSCDFTFSKTDGSMINSIIDRSRTNEMQRLLIKGLKDYFQSEEGFDFDCISLDNGLVPLPSNEPSFTEDGLKFIYQEYEIVPSAMGMPSFTIPYDDIREFLTPQAKALL